MTIGELLRTLKIEDQSTRAIYSDGSEQTDVYTLLIMLDGHGIFLDAEVKRVTVRRGCATIEAEGIGGGTV